MKSRALNNEELPKMIARLQKERDSMWLALFCTLYFLGVRVSEALTMTRGTVEDKDGNIRSAFCFVCLKKKRQLKVFRKCPPDLARILRIWLDEMAALYAKFNQSELLFCRYWNRDPISRYGAALKFKRIAKEIGIDPNGISAHTPRKTFAFRLYTEAIRRMQEKGSSDPLYPVRTVQKALHHEDPRTTLSYLPDTSGPVEEFFDALSVDNNNLTKTENSKK